VAVPARLSVLDEQETGREPDAVSDALLKVALG